jgi:hypothetical protein
MPITRTELHKQYLLIHRDATEKLITNMFNTVCDEITIYNSYGTTSYCLDLKYRQYWTHELVDKVVEKLKLHFTDCEVFQCDRAINVNWSLPKNNSEINDDVADNSATIVGDNENNKNIQINITLPSRITRSSTRK